MDTKFENIVPWNGSNDTGRDVRLKWERNFKRIADALKELSDTDKQIIKDILKEIDKIYPVSYTHLTLPTNREV